MTGYGKAEESMNGVTVKVELRSLNNRYLDLNLRVSAFLREKEQEIRSVITDQLQRGKIDATVIWQSEAGAASTINRELLKAYYREIKSLAKELGESKKNLLALAFKMPDVMSPEKGSISEEEWELAKRVLNKALGDLVMFRTNEGGHWNIHWMRM